MAGSLTLSTLSDGTNSTNATDVIRGSARAWANFNGSAATIRASYNVSSVTRAGTGQYTINYTNALTDANYSITGTVNSDSRTLSIGSLSTTSSAMRSTNTAGAFDDVTMVTIVVFR